MLWSHKLCRWLVPWALVLMLVALATRVGAQWWAGAALAAGGVAGLLAAIGWMWPEGTGSPLPRLLALPTYAVTSNIAALHAWLRALGSTGTALWEPTRRGRTSEREVGEV